MSFRHTVLRRCLTSLAMDLRQLRYFVTVAEELHFARAASRLLITSPTLSQQVKALERDLGLRLFDRSSSGVRLTAAGVELLPGARRTLAAADDLREAAARVRRGVETSLRLGFVSFSLTAPARRLVTDFSRGHPDVDLQLRQFEWDDPSAGLLDGSSDAALVRPPFTGLDRLRTVEVGRDRLHLVLADDHPLAGSAGITVADLARLPFLRTHLVTDPVFADRWYLARLRGPDAPVVSSRAATVEEWLGEIGLGRGVDLVPEGMVEAYRQPGLAFVPVSGTDPSPVVLAWDPRRETDCVRSLVALAEQAGATV